MTIISKIAVATVLAGAIAAGATSADAARLGKRWADANGYFYYPGNAVDDMYVYDPPAAARRMVGVKARHARHRHRR